MIFLDASVLLAAEDSTDAHHHAARALLRTGAIGTLDLALYEATNIAEGRWHDPEASRRLRDRLFSSESASSRLRVATVPKDSMIR